MYSFTIRYTGAFNQCYPRYTELLLEKGIESTMGKRTTCSTEFEFVGDDFTAITTQPFGTKFTIRIKDGSTLVYQGYFLITDCEIDYDKKILKTGLKTLDYYDEVGSILDKEVNLTDIVSKKVKTTHSVLPLIQIYAIGDAYLTNYLGGVTWKQDCTIVNYDDYEGSEWWRETSLGSLTAGSRTMICHIGEYQNAVFYSNSGTIGGFQSIFLRDDGLFFITITGTGATTRYEIKDVATVTTSWVSEYFTFEDEVSEYYFNNILDLEFTNVFHGYKFYFNDHKRVVYRVLVNETWKSPNFQLVENKYEICRNEMYPYIVRLLSINVPSVPILAVPFEIKASISTSANETEYQKSGTNRYFNRLVSDNDFAYIPIGQEIWHDMSLWIRGNETIHTEVSNDAVLVENQGYEIKDVFNAIFTYYNIPLVFQSQFLNGVNPISGINKKAVISNLTNFQVENPIFATNNKLTLGSLIEFLSSRFNLSWSIKDGKFIMEHIYYYTNNESYTPNSDFTDLTARQVTRLEKAWTNLTNLVKYDVNSYQRWEFKEDYASKLLGEGLITTEYPILADVRKQDFYDFYTDVAYIMNNDIGDGFIFGLYDTNYNLELISLLLKGERVLMQNAYAVLPFTLPSYFGYNDFGTDVTIDGTSQSVRGVFRGKEQELELPYTTMPNEYKNVKTELGIGFCKKIIVNLTKKTVKYILSHVID